MAFFDFLHIFSDLFHSTEKAWQKLEPEVQNALIHGSGIIKILNDNIEKTPDEIFALIQQKYPDITKEKLEGALTKVNTDLGIAGSAVAPDLETSIQNLQKYLSSLKGKFWETASSILSQSLAIIFAPDETPFAKVVQFIEWVFRKKVKA
jgi:hypothetical protein